MGGLRLFCIFCLLSSSSLWSCWGQEITSVERTRTYIEDYLQRRVDFGALTQEEVSEYLNRLNYYLQNPLDINQIHLEDLEQIPFLSPYQVYQFITYRTNHNNQFTSLYDLKLIPGWDEETIRWALPLFRYTAKKKLPSLSNIFEQGKSSFGLFSSWRESKTDKQKPYLGNKLHWGIQWRWQSGNALSSFVAVEQDAGEPFRYHRHIGPDSYAYHIRISRGIIRQFILGDYRVNWGEGLVMNQSYFKLRNTFSNRLPAAEGIHPVGGWSEMNKNRGIALTLGTDSLRLSLIASWRRLDGHIVDGVIYGLSEGGLHRTLVEWQRRQTVPYRQFGAKISYGVGNFQLSLQTLSSDFGKYALAHPAGSLGNPILENLRKQHNTSFSYHYQNRTGELHLLGEVAYSNLDAWATTHRISYFSERWGTTNLSARYIGANYWSYYGMSHTHYNHITNERGIMMDYQAPRYRHWDLRIFTDYYQSIQPRKRSISSGLRLMTQLSYADLSPWGLRVQCSISQHPSQKAYYALSTLMTYAFAKGWKYQCHLSASREQRLKSIKTYLPPAYSISMGVNYQGKEQETFSFFTTYYRIPQGGTSLFLPTPRLLYDTQTVFLRGQGVRLQCLGKYRVGKHWQLGGDIRMLIPLSEDKRMGGYSFTLNMIYR